MIEVSIHFSNVHGMGVEVFTVNVEADGFDFPPYAIAIKRSLDELKKRRGVECIPTRVTVRDVPPKAEVLEP